jgi:hypothetical protein
LFLSQKEIDVILTPEPIELVSLLSSTAGKAEFIA